MQSGTRPCIIVSADLFNKYAPTIVLIPLTTTLKNTFPSEFIIEPSKINGLPEKSRFLGSQIITIDKEFLSRKIGSLDSEYKQEMEKALKLVLDI